MLASAFALWWAVPIRADAANISNKDGKAYEVTIEERGSHSTHEVAPGESLDGVCLRGCVVILGGVEDGAYRLPEGNEIVTIEEGVLFYDGAIAARPEEDTAPGKTGER